MANWSEGRISTGTRFVVARAAPVTMLSEPGPMEAVIMYVDIRLRTLAKAEAAWTAPCSLRGMM